MRPAFARLAAPMLAALLLGSACTSTRSSTSKAPRSDSSLITSEQIAKHRFANAYEAVEALHSNWLLNKSADSFNAPSQKLHEGLGFTLEGPLRPMIYTGGEFHDVLWYGITKEEFEAKHSTE